MAATREQIMQALLALLATAYPFAVTGRRNVAPDRIAQPGQPALILLKSHEFIKNDAMQPALRARKMNVLACCYFDASNDPNAVPDAIINDMTDAIEAKLARPDNALTQTLTLGGLCHAVRIAGQIDNAPGDQTGKGLAIIPIEIVMP
ncbi:MAG: hypothetical protein QM651_16020 [Rhodoblastus sp.]